MINVTIENINQIRHTELVYPFDKLSISVANQMLIKITAYPESIQKVNTAFVLNTPSQISRNIIIEPILFVRRSSFPAAPFPCVWKDVSLSATTSMVGVEYRPNFVRINKNETLRNDREDLLQRASNYTVDTSFPGDIKVDLGVILRGSKSTKKDTKSCVQ